MLMSSLLNSNWCWDEFQQIGKDYTQPEEVDVYDSSHSDFRDVEAENAAILKRLQLSKDATLIEIGTGTGAFSVQAASEVKFVHALDVSEAMLEATSRCAKSQGVSNLQVHHSGFLSYQHEGVLADAVVTSLALHHLPDFWKAIALERIHQMLKPGGQLYLVDVVLEQEEAVSNIQSFINSQAEKGGDFLREDAEGHFRDEFSTYDWVMEGLLTRAKFEVRTKESLGGILATYHCDKA